MRNGQWVKFRIAEDAPVLVERSRQVLPPGMEEPPPGRSFEEVAIEERYTEGIALPARWRGLWDAVQKTPEGFVVGVYQRAGKDSTGLVWPDHVVPVEAESGLNLRWIEDGNLRLLCLAADAVTDLEPVVSRAELPAQRAQHLPEDWRPAD